MEKEILWGGVIFLLPAESVSDDVRTKLKHETS